MNQPFDFDALAKELAGGLSRREALRRLGGALAGSLLASLGLGASAGPAGAQGLVGPGLCQRNCEAQAIFCADSCNASFTQAESDIRRALFVCQARCPSGVTGSACRQQCAATAAQEQAAAGQARDACRNQCVAARATCEAGCPCAGGCPNGLTCCGGTCVDTQSDAHNCGHCGYGCESAAGGACCGGVCTHRFFDSGNCGACGNVCPPDSVCRNSTCTPCAVGETVCPGQCLPDEATDCRYCANRLTSAHDCGACGHICESGDACLQGVCAPCPSGQLLCLTGCVDPADLQTDVNNCGACDNVCRDGLSCCSGQCVDLSSDADNCGGCGSFCSGTCVSGRCVCGSGLTLCYNGQCVDLSSDRFNCGGCGIVCSGPCVDRECTGPLE